MKVLVTGDTQRPVSEQEGNIRLMWSVIKMIEPNAEIFIGNGNRVSMAEWKSWPEGKETEVARYVKDNGFDKVYGFELHDATLAQLKDGNVYNIKLHPVRFGPDLLFGCTRDIFNLRKTEWESIFRRWALIEEGRNWRQKSHTKPFGLVVGQTLIDRAMIGFPGYANLAIPRDIDVYFKPHPHERELKTQWNSTDNVFGGMSVYEIMSDPMCKWVAGWNSSVLTEAKYFNKEVYRFGPNWAEGLIPFSSWQLGIPEGSIRRMIGENWGYKK